MSPSYYSRREEEKEMKKFIDFMERVFAIGFAVVIGLTLIAAAKALVVFISS